MKVLLNHHEMEKRNVVSILEVVEVATGTRKVLREFDSVIEAPNWLRNGKDLIYNAEGHIYSYEIETGLSTLIDTGVCNHCNNDHVLSPDHLQIAVSHHTYEDEQSRIYRLPLQGGTPVLITPIAPSYLHGWSPDGETLAYCAERNGEYDIYTIPAVGGVETKLTDTPGLNDGPEYSPCGKYIWFNSVRSGLMQIWRMKSDGSEQTQMTFDESNNWFAHLSPDGNTVAYISYKKDDVAPGDHPANKNVEIRLMPSDGGEYKTLVQLFGGQGTLNVNSWSPCSKKIAFVSYRLK
jgi:Tol biopolymer transport system component